MRWPFLFATLLPACAGAPSPAPSAPRGAAPELDDAAARARAHEFFDAVDRHDRAAFQEITTSGFVLFEHGHAKPPELLFDYFEGKPARTRTCTAEDIHRSRSALVYTGDCTEKLPPHGDRKEPREVQGWNTVVLVPQRGDWKVALWQWERSGPEAERARWNRVFRRGTGFSREPNRHLKDVVEDLSTGDALVVAMGQGRNTLYLASRGWEVTGVDISDEAIRAARAAAEERGLELRAVLADGDEYDFGAERWDLVTMIYAGAEPDWLQRIKPSVKPGGRFVLEFFRATESHPLGVEPEKLAEAFSDWEIVQNEVVRDVADWGEREQALVRFVARKPGPQ